MLNQAVKRQLISDVPVGFFLSGGLDSSLLVAISRKMFPNKNLKCYTIDTNTDTKTEGFENDLPYAVKVARLLNVDLEIVDGDFKIVQQFDQMIYHLDEPQADAAPLSVSNIAKKAREQGYYVLLSGAGGDDLFTGYRRHQLAARYRTFDRIPDVLKKTITSIVDNLNYTNLLSRRLKKLTSIFKHGSIEYNMASVYGWLGLDELYGLFNEKIIYNPLEQLVKSLKGIPEERNIVNRMLFWELKYFLADHNLNYTDKMSMAHGVEVRVPYLDKDLVEFSTEIPVEMKMKGITTKYILRKVAERYLPNDIICRSKTGFGGPVRDWVKTDLAAEIDSRLFNDDRYFNEIFDLKTVRSLVERNKSGQIDAAYTIWGLLAINSWLNQFNKNNDFFN